jgi:hypothetical protein
VNPPVRNRSAHPRLASEDLTEPVAQAARSSCPVTATASVIRRHDAVDPLAGGP